MHPDIDDVFTNSHGRMRYIRWGLQAVSTRVYPTVFEPGNIVKF
jgi:hypothetical protein